MAADTYLDDDISKIAQFIPGRDVAARFFVGYQRQLSAGMAIGHFAAEGGVWRILLFGFPGCGKSEYPFVLAHSLNERFGTPFSVLYVKCHRLASMYDDVGKMKGVLRDLTDKVRGFQPTIVAFDEFDAISPRRSSLTSSLTELSLWAMSFLANGSDVDSKKKILVLGITNFPQQMDVAVRDRLQYPIYFETAPKDVLVSIIEHNGINGANEIADRILEMLTQVGQTITGRGIALAFKALRRINGADYPACLLAMSSEEVAQLLCIHAQPVSAREITDYAAQNWQLVRQSDAVMKYWLDEYAKLPPRP